MSKEAMNILWHIPFRAKKNFPDSNVRWMTPRLHPQSKEFMSDIVYDKIKRSCVGNPRKLVERRCRLVLIKGELS